MLKGFLHYYDENDPPQGGGDAGDPPIGDGKVRASDLRAQLGSAVDEQALMRILEKQAELLSDNHKLRERMRKLRDVPASSRVLTADEAAAYDAYVALGDPDDVKTKLGAAEQAAADLATMRRGEHIRAAAEAHGYKSAALAKLPSLRDQEIVLRDIQEDGKTVKRAYVGDTALPDYIAANDPEFLSSLAAETPPQGGGQSFPQQSAGGSPPGDLATRYIAQRDEKRKAQTNPLMPKQGA